VNSFTRCEYADGSGTLSGWNCVEKRFERIEKNLANLTRVVIDLVGTVGELKDRMGAPPLR